MIRITRRNKVLTVTFSFILCLFRQNIGAHIMTCTHDRCSKPFIQFVFLSITHNTNIRSMYMMVEDSTPAVSLYILHKKCNFSDIF